MLKKRQKLVVIPGWSNDSSGRMWHYQKQHLQEQVDMEFIVISDRSTIEDAADEILSRCPEQFALLGHSMGGMIAQYVAVKAPQRVQNLILVATCPGNFPPEQRTFFEEGLSKLLQGGTSSSAREESNKACVAPHRANDRILLESLQACQKLTDEELVHQTKIILSMQDISKKLSAITAPTLILYGRQDQFFSMGMQKTMLEHLNNAKLVIIEDCGHVPALEQPQAVTSIISLWLQMTTP